MEDVLLKIKIQKILMCLKQEDVEKILNETFKDIIKEFPTSFPH